MKIHDRVIAFTRFLSMSWESAAAMIDDATDADEFMENWEQANWELLVEWSLGPNRFLVPLNAADIYDGPSRATYPDATPTDMILCMSDVALVDRGSGRQVDLRAGLPIEHFVSFDGQSSNRVPPFDYVCLRTSANQFPIFRCDEVTFEVVPYREL